MNDSDDLLEKADNLRKEGDRQGGLDCFRKYLLKNNALLWFANLSENPDESFAAADLALKLEPENEVAQRAIINISKQLPQKEIQPDDITKLILRTTEMTLSQARSVIWPFNHINRPIGEAFDNGQIELKDIAWASVKAYDKHIKCASQTVLLSHLLETESLELPPPLKITNGSRYSERKERISLMIGGMLLGAVLTLSLVPTATIIAGFLGWLTYKFNVLAIFSLLFIIALCMFIAEKFLEKFNQYKIGRLGEEKAVEKLLYSLDGRWHLIRNFEWQNRKWGDIDIILIGSGGIWVFEVKAYRGMIRNIGDKWQKKGKFGWYNLSSHPGRQVRRNAVRLKEFFSESGLKVSWINPVVLWAGELSTFDDEKGTLILETPQTPVWKVGNIDENIDEFLQNSNFKDSKDEAVNLLMKTIKKTKSGNKQN